VVVSLADAGTGFWRYLHDKKIEVSGLGDQRLCQMPELNSVNQAMDSLERVVKMEEYFRRKEDAVFEEAFAEY
jgi:hypothetical protein